jgi:hypothetical protein
LFYKVKPRYRAIPPHRGSRIPQREPDPFLAKTKKRIQKKHSGTLFAIWTALLLFVVFLLRRNEIKLAKYSEFMRNVRRKMAIRILIVSFQRAHIREFSLSWQLLHFLIVFGTSPCPWNALTAYCVPPRGEVARFRRVPFSMQKAGSAIFFAKDVSCIM